MQQIATITSKKQLTLPASLFKKVGFKTGDKVIVSDKNGSLVISSAVKLVEELAGSVSVPIEWKGKDIDEIVKIAKNKYFKEKMQKT